MTGVSKLSSCAAAFSIFYSALASAVFVSQDMSPISGVGQEFGYNSYQQVSTPAPISQFSLDATPDPACVFTPNATISDSNFIPQSDQSTSGGGFFQRQINGSVAGDTSPTVTAPAAISTTVNGYANFIDLDPANGGALPEVSDSQNSSFDFSHATNAVVGPLPPGHHILTWQATDKNGNQGSAEQSLDIIPRVNFEADQITTEGKRVNVTAHLSGAAAQYPVLIPYTVSGTATPGTYVDAVYINPPSADHNAADGVITIESGTIGQTSFNVVSDNFTSGTTEADETVIFTMGAPTNAVTGEKSQHTVTITDSAQKLVLNFDISQNNKITPLVTTDNGQIKVTAAPLNGNYLEIPTYDWSQSNASLVSADCHQSSFYVDPTNLSPGLYRIHVTATETNFPDQASSAEWWLRVGTPPALNDSADSDGDGIDDSTEGFQDEDNDGIPNYLDVVDAPYLIPGYDAGGYKSLDDKALLNNYHPQAGEVGWNISDVVTNINYPMLIATEPGLKLGAGSNHLSNYENTRNVALALDEANTLDDGITVDPLFDSSDPLQNDGNQFMISLELSHLPKAGGTARLVIPQTTAADTSQGYNYTVRNYTPAFGWEDFLQDNDNLIASSPREGDYCPPAGSAQYQPGLIDGFECLQLTIQDGGANDADGYRNGRITFNGGVLPVQYPEQKKDEAQTEKEIDLQTQTDSDSKSASTQGSAPGGGGVLSLTPLLCLLRLAGNRKTLKYK